MSSIEKYTVEVRCGNCGLGSRVPWEVQVTMGTPVSQKPCPNCGCKELYAPGANTHIRFNPK